MKNPENIVLIIAAVLCFATIAGVWAISKRREERRIEWARAFCEKLGIPASEEKIKRMTYRETPVGDFGGGDLGWGDSGGGDGDGGD